MKIGPKDSKNGVAWKKSELETLGTYAMVSEFIHLFLSFVMMACAGDFLFRQGFYHALRILLWLTLVMVVFLCICPLARVLTDHQIGGPTIVLWRGVSGVTGWLQRQVENSSFLFHMAAQTFAIVWWILAFVFLVIKAPEGTEILSGHDAAMISTLVIMAMLDTVLQLLVFIEVIRCEQLVTPADGNIEETNANKEKSHA